MMERFELLNPKLDYNIQCEKISDNGNMRTYGEIVEYLNCFLQESKDNEHYHLEILKLYESVSKENEKLKQENQEFKRILQDMGLLRSDEEVINIRNEISDKILKPLFEENGFDVDINTDKGFTIIPKR